MVYCLNSISTDTNSSFYMSAFTVCTKMSQYELMIYTSVYLMRPMQAYWIIGKCIAYWKERRENMVFLA